MKTNLTEQEFATLTLGMAKAIEDYFESNEKFSVYLTESKVHYEPTVGFEVFTLRVIATKKETNRIMEE